MSFHIEVESGTSVRLTTGGTYCDRDIVVTATGGMELPPLEDSVEGGAEDLVTGKKLYNDSGEVVSGTNPYEKAATDAVVSEQETLLDQALLAIANKTAGSGSGDPVIQPLTVTPSEDEQNFNAVGIDGYAPVTVEAISETYVGSGVTRKSAEQIRPGTNDLYIESGTYLTGRQTVLGDANLKPENIKKDVTIFNVLGIFEGSGGSGGGSGDFIDSGEFTLSSDSSSLNVSHNLGRVPDYWFVYADETPTLDTFKDYSVDIFRFNRPFVDRLNRNNYTIEFYPDSNSFYSDTLTSATIKDTATAIKATLIHPLKANVRYKWVCGVLWDA